LSRFLFVTLQVKGGNRLPPSIQPSGGRQKKNTPIKNLTPEYDVNQGLRGITMQRYKIFLKHPRKNANK